MNSTTKIVIGLLIIAGVIAGGAYLFWGNSDLGRNHSAPAQSDQLYTCGMHPTVIMNKPGNCPICGMKLTPVRKQTGTNSTVIFIDPVTIQNMGIRTGVVTNGPLRRMIRAAGMVDYDETTLAEVSTKFRGWIEKLYVDATGKPMRRGEPLFEIYSPELFLAQTEYLLTLGVLTNADSAAAGRRASALSKLKFWDISDEQVAELERTGKPKKTLQVTAPRDGIVVEKMIVEGQMVEAGAKLYRLADLSTVWVQAQVYEQDLALIQLGQEAEVTLAYLPDRKFRGRVTYLYPLVDEKTRTTRVRMEFQNPGYVLKPGMFATVELHAELASAALLVPDSAVLRSGERNTVFVALEGGHFDPRTVTVGLRSENDLYQVLSGLNEGERVVVSGQFMLDSESQLHEAIQKMRAPAKPEPSGGPTSRDANPGSQETFAAMPSPLYTCPMAEHADVVSDKPGKCPKCEMKLVETGKVKHGKVAEAHWRKTHPAPAAPQPQHRE